MKIKLDHEQKKELGKFLIDISKLTFGGLVLTNIIKVNSEHPASIFFLSSFAIFALLIFGLILIKK